MCSFVARGPLGWCRLVALALAAGGCGSSGEDGDPPATGSGVRWCEASGVLEAKCQRCHVGTGLNGAPFPLVTYDDTQVIDAAGDPRWKRMQAMVEMDAMPPDFVKLDPPAEKLTASEKELLLSWFEQGAEPVGGSSCP